MKVYIDDIQEEGLDLDLEEKVELNFVISTVRARLNIEKVDAEIFIKGHLTVNITLQCSRCLTEFTSLIEVPVDVVYQPVEEVKFEENHEITTDELDVDFYSGEELDLLDLLQEQIVLNLPMKPLCSEMCKGICIKCGENLNTGNCTCVVDDIDPRLAVLKKLLN